MSRSTVRVDTSSSSASSLADRRPRCWSSRRSERRRSARTSASIAEKHDTRCRDCARGWPMTTNTDPRPAYRSRPDLGAGEGPQRRTGGARPADAVFRVRRTRPARAPRRDRRPRPRDRRGRRPARRCPSSSPGCPTTAGPPSWPPPSTRRWRPGPTTRVLDRDVTVPWGRVPGGRRIWGYLNEALVHGWDLAVATGQDSEADPGLAEAGLAVGQADPARELPRWARAVRRGRGVGAGRGPDRAARELGGPPPLGACGRGSPHA